MPVFAHVDLRKLGREMMEAVGVPQPVATIVADHLVESGLRGHDTHSVLRFPQYVEAARSGKIDSSAEFQILHETNFIAQVSGGWNYGQVTMNAAVELATKKAANAGFAVVTVKECNHVARLGHFAAVATAHDRIAIITSNGHGSDLAVAPLGGIARRLPTNPLAIGIPTGRDWPILLDMTTSAMSGGDMRWYRNRGLPLPPGNTIDHAGEPTRDVEAYYGPPAGAILPLGFPDSGHKGYGLSIVVDILSGALSRAGCSQEYSPETGNALFIGVLDVASFLPLEGFRRHADALIDWIKSSAPADGFDEVVLPGENSHRIYLERSREGLEVDDKAWVEIAALASQLEVQLPPPAD